MNILFLTLIAIDNLEDRSIYHDLMRKFRDEGNRIAIVSPLERGSKRKFIFRTVGAVTFLRVKTLKIQQSSIIEKGLGTLLIQSQFTNAINEYLNDTKFDLIIYSTPPISFAGVIETIKKRDKSKTYLLLKDIFPQNAVDIKLFKENGFLHKYFLRKEKRLYSISDFIGCMSSANVNYLLKEHPDLINKIEVNPNSIEPKASVISEEEFYQMREELNLPIDKTIFIYGGNLGKPQGIDFLMDILLRTKNYYSIFFVIIGDGTEYEELQKFIKNNDLKNVFIDKWMKKEKYEQYLTVSDVGLIFLNKNFTIPNFPSRILAYMEKGKPVLCATDLNTDVGKIAVENNFGYFCESGDIEEFIRFIHKYTEDKDLRDLHGKNSLKYLQENYTVTHSYNTIIKHFN